MTCRPATPDDADGIAQLHAESWRAAYRGSYPDAYLDGEVWEDRRTVWRERLGAEDARRFVLLAKDGDTLAGFICVYAQEDAEWGSLVDNLHVAPGRHRSGIGRLLMREGARWLQEWYPGVGVYLGVLEANDNARRFYERLAGRNEGATEKETPGGGTASICRYVWESPAALLRAASEEP